jgi:cold-inducible RNA-binding protein
MGLRDRSRKVERVNIVTDKETGRSKGFGFVEMTQADEADKACLALSGSELGGRALRVEKDRGRETSSAQVRE